MDQNGGVNPLTPVPDTSNQVPTLQYSQTQPTPQSPIQPLQPQPQIQYNSVNQPQPTSFEMVAPVQQQTAADYTYQQPQPSVAYQESTQPVPSPLPAQPQPSNFEMVTPAQLPSNAYSTQLSSQQYLQPMNGEQQVAPSVPVQPQPLPASFENPATSQQYSPQQPTNFELVNQAPVQSSQPADPLIREDVRPAWQQEIYQDLSDNNFMQSQANSMQSPLTQQPNFSEPDLPAYNQFDQPELINTFEQPEQPFNLSYDSSTGDPVEQAPGKFGLQAWLPRIIVIILLLGAFGGGGYGAYTFGSNAGYKKGMNDARREQARRLAEEASTQQSNTEEDEASLDFSLVEPEYKDESIEGLVAEQVQASDGLVVYVKNVEREFQPTSTSYQLDSSSELVKINILVGNAATSQSKEIKNENFTLELTDGTIIAAATDLGTYDGQIGSVSLTPGGKARFSVIFEVPKGAESLKLVRRQPYILKDSGQTINMQMTIGLE